MNLRLTAILLLIVAVLGGVYLTQDSNSDNDLSQLLKKEGAPEYSGNKVSTTVYDLKGKPQYFAEANKIEYYENSGRSEFFNPLLNLFNPQTALKQWQVTADYAEIGKDKILNLKGNVKLQNLETKAKLSLIETEYLSINLTTQDISTESAVKSKGMGFTTTGTGLTGNLKKQTATLLKDVKTYIEPTIIKQENEPKDAQ